MDPYKPFFVVSTRLEEEWEKASPMEKKRVLKILRKSMLESYRNLEEKDESNKFGSAPV
jgi:hypothetical protein